MNDNYTVTAVKKTHVGWRVTTSKGRGWGIRWSWEGAGAVLFIGVNVRAPAVRLCVLGCGLHCGKIPNVTVEHSGIQSIDIGDES